MKANIIASIALFQDLYNNGKKDIFSVISEFVKVAIAKNNLHTFNTVELKNSLKEDFEIEVPEAILKTVLSKRLNDCVSKEIIVNGNGFKELIYSSIIEFDVEQFNADLVQLSDKYSYVFDKLKSEIKNSNVKDEELIEGFVDYILKGRNEREDCLYSKFILKYEYDNVFTACLNEIKEGYVILSGIKDIYDSTDINSTSSWNSKLVIYLDTEHLFSYYGYNGELFKNTLLDFITLVDEANKKTKYIELKYFEETKSAIESFFGAAIMIKDKTLRPYSSTAMNSIIKKCSDAGDVLLEKGKFYAFLREKGICCDERACYVKEMEGNLQTDENINIILDNSKENNYNFDKEDIAKYLRMFSIINLKRDCNNRTGFDRCRYILMTGNSIASYIAWHPNIKSESDFSFSSDIDYITSRLWFRLHKGLVKTKQLVSFNVVSKAKIIIASLLYKSASDKYDQLKNQKYSKDEEIDVFNAIREHEIYPEDINNKNIDDIVDFINIKDVDDLRREASYLKEKAKEGEKSTKELKQLKFNILKTRKDHIRYWSIIIIYLINILLFLFILGLSLIVYYVMNIIITPDDSIFSIVCAIVTIIFFPLLSIIPYISKKKAKYFKKMKLRFFRAKLKRLPKI